METRDGSWGLWRLRASGTAVGWLLRCRGTSAVRALCSAASGAAGQWLCCGRSRTASLHVTAWDQPKLALGLLMMCRHGHDHVTSHSPSLLALGLPLQHRSEDLIWAVDTLETAQDLRTGLLWPHVMLWSAVSPWGFHLVLSRDSLRQVCSGCVCAEAFDSFFGNRRAKRREGGVGGNDAGRTL